MKTKMEMLWKDGKRKALTFSYDDGTIHDRKLVALMNTYGMKGTFNLNSGLFGKTEQAVINGIDTDFSRISNEEAETLFAGHEVACHTLTHPSLTEIPMAMGRSEVLEDCRNLERLTGKKVTGFAYPYGTFNDKVEEMLDECGISYARTVVSTESFEVPQEFLEWHPTCHHESPKLMELAGTFLEKDTDTAKLFYVWGHSYEFAQKDNWQVIEELFKLMQEHAQDIWFATNEEIASYVKAYRELQISSDGQILYNPSETDLWYGVGKETDCIRGGERRKLN